MSVTIKDIARLAGVSYSTVSKALNNSPLVRNEKKQRIRELAKQLGYQPNMVAKSLVSKRSMYIGIVMPAMDRVATTALLECINHEFARRKYDIVLSMLPTEAALDLFQRLRVDGMIVFEDSETSSVTNRLNTEIPTVSIGSSHVFGTRYALVDAKRKEAIRQAVRHLYALGHRVIAYCGDARESDHTQYEKVIGFYEEASVQAIPREGTIVLDCEGSTWSHGYAVGQKLVALETRPTAVITGGYELTTGLLQSLKDNHIRIPEDMSLISYDNVSKLADLPVPVTGVGPLIETFAERIATVLIENIQREGSIQMIDLLETTIVDRQSCRAVHC